MAHSRTLASALSVPSEYFVKQELWGCFIAVTTGGPVSSRARGSGPPVATSLLLGPRVQGFIISVDGCKHDMIGK